jgi:NNP family nitrate/nitrite transporter-like MFS transporter
VGYNEFFMIIGISGAFVLLLISIFLEEPKGVMTEVLEDGTVELIKLN